MVMVKHPFEEGTFDLRNECERNSLAMSYQTCKDPEAGGSVIYEGQWCLCYLCAECHKFREVHKSQAA